MREKYLWFVLVFILALMACVSRETQAHLAYAWIGPVIQAVSGLVGSILGNKAQREQQEKENEYQFKKKADELEKASAQNMATGQTNAFSQVMNAYRSTY